MNLTLEQKNWLKVATAQDLARAYIKKEWDYSYYKEIEKEWLEIHQEIRQDIHQEIHTDKKQKLKIIEDWGKPDAWI